MMISGRTPITAGATNSNILQGQYIEFLPHDCILQFGLTSDEAAITADNILVDVLIGTEIVARQYVPRASAVQPVFPDDFHLSHAAPAGDRLIIGVQNKAGATKNLFWVIIMDAR